MATMGYEDMTPLDDLGTVSTLFAMQLAVIVIMLIGFCCHCTTGSMCCKRFSSNLKHFALWGFLINLIVVAYLPVTTATFISIVGLQWDGADEQAVLLNNVWTIFILHAWLLCPLLLFIMLFKNRKVVGAKEPRALEKRDASKIQWKKDWVQI